MGEKYPRFSDFAEEEAPLEGKKRKIEEILKIEIMDESSKALNIHNPILKIYQFKRKKNDARNI